MITKVISAHLCFFQSVHLPESESLEDKVNEVSIIYLPLEKREIKPGMTLVLGITSFTTAKMDE